MNDPFINDEYMAYMLKYDTVHGRYDGPVSGANGFITVDGKKIKTFAEKDPSKINWGDAGVDVVVESTGVFTTLAQAQVHLDKGAKKVRLAAFLPLTCLCFPGLLKTSRLKRQLIPSCRSLSLLLRQTPPCLLWA